MTSLNAVLVVAAGGGGGGDNGGGGGAGGLIFMPEVPVTLGGTVVWLLVGVVVVHLQEHLKEFAQDKIAVFGASLEQEYCCFNC